VLLKTIGKKKYAYLAYRRGDKIVQKYLGPAEDKRVAQQIERSKSEKMIPEKLFKLFWDADPAKIKLGANGRYIIERILETGDMEAFEWMQRIYPARMIIEVFETSRKVSQKSKNFWEIWYGTENAH